MSKVIEKTDFITVSKVTKVQIDINEEFVLERVNEYLQKKQVAGSSYKATDLKIDYPLKVSILLERINSEFEIDEDFDSDEEWERFTSDLAEKLKVKYVGVPYYYYPK